MKKTAFSPNERGHPTQLPKEYVDWITQPVTRFLKIEAAAGVVLLFFTIVALVLSNSPWSETFLSFWEIPLGIKSGSFEYTRSLQEWINDAVMTLFFFLVALELKREIVLGELKKPRLAMLSISGAMGGMLVPALIYLVFQLDQPGQNGWGIVMATDTAFVIACLILLGPRVPKSLRIFMLSLAIIDDIGAIIVVAVGYGEEINYYYLGIAALGVIGIKAMAELGIRSIAIYSLIGGLIWLSVDASGIHPTVTGVILGLMTPTISWVSKERLLTIMDCVIPAPATSKPSEFRIDRKVLKTAEAAAREALSPLERLEMLLHPWVGFVIMPLFAFANAGVQISFSELSGSLYTAIVAGLVIGKPTGIILFSGLATLTKLAVRPPDLPWLYIIAGGMLAGIGFTMSLFIAHLALSPELVDVAKLGILSASLFSALVGIGLLSWLLKRDTSLKGNGE
ncbi:Na+/H+ antiporter NhaA [Photobacterium ganghwense]|uniref:Na(+)/H(+) antiporter NhaA n=1 Tax=Photobacterium ganghwense TaxID=320778 RepID=A0A0J1HAE8_9GAMM|nr:Na+/H+ antiporter NhaA [Photobacterium ganghwense]KLV08646.1 sodium:proton antiporter [Photobacterium ganghwense]PSU10766.1 Na+/H+ antiporter NhaA [Photobacterium ganghwense]